MLWKSLTKKNYSCTLKSQLFTSGGCYVIAKRNELINVILPQTMLKTLNKGVPVECISTPLSFDPHGPLPKHYKLHYGIRFSGYHEPTQKPIFYGFDLFYQVTGNGLDLEGFLGFCFTHGFHIDWYNFQRTSREKGNWTYTILIRKLSYPIIEVFGKQYWQELKHRFMRYEWENMEEGSELKERFRSMFI